MLIAGILIVFDEIVVEIEEPKFTPGNDHEPATEPPLLGVMFPVIAEVFPGQIDCVCELHCRTGLGFKVIVAEPVRLCVDAAQPLLSVNDCIVMVEFAEGLTLKK